MPQAKPATPWNRYFLVILLFGMAGALAASWIAPRTIAWYFEPPVNIGLNCRPATEWSMSRLQMAQLSGLVMGLVAGLAASVFWARRRNDDAPL